MAIELDLSPDLQARIDRIAARSGLSVSEVVADALENGRSIEWQEWFLEKVAAGQAAADAGEFASPSDVARILDKYRPA